MKRNAKAFVVYQNEIKQGIFISRGRSWNYVLYENGDVTGYSDGVVFPTIQEAQAYLIEELRGKLTANVTTFLNEVIKIKEVKKD